VITAAPLIGLGTGMLLAAVGLAVWNGLQQVKGAPHAIRAISWMASGFLLFALPFLWIEAHSRYWIILHLTLMAAIAAPLTGRDRPGWRNVIAVLPGLVLASAGFLLVVGAALPEPRISELGLVGLALMVFSGFVARVLGETLVALVSPDTPPRRLLDALYLLLTLLVGANALVSLWRRGVAWEGSGSEGGLIGAWLAWSAAWLSRRWHPRLRAGLIAVAALLLILLMATASQGWRT
jgi:hypothetical protein